jgi:hypothetical protein
MSMPDFRVRAIDCRAGPPTLWDNALVACGDALRCDFEGTSDAFGLGVSPDGWFHQLSTI